MNEVLEEMDNLRSENDKMKKVLKATAIGLEQLFDWAESKGLYIPEDSLDLRDEVRNW
jgi:hypothetical protein